MSLSCNIDLVRAAGLSGNVHRSHRLSTKRGPLYAPRTFELRHCCWLDTAAQERDPWPMILLTSPPAIYGTMDLNWCSLRNNLLLRCINFDPGRRFRWAVILP